MKVSGSWHKHLIAEKCVLYLNMLITEKGRLSLLRVPWDVGESATVQVQIFRKSVTCTSKVSFLFLKFRISSMFLRSLPRAVYRPLLRSFTTHATRPRTRLNTLTCNALARSLSTTPVRRDLTNILADENPPPVQVNSISEDGILLADGLLLPSSCIFFDGQVFLWDVPQKLWEGWSPERFEFFEATLNRPGL